MRTKKTNARRNTWPVRPDGTQKTMAEMTRAEQDAALAPILTDLEAELKIVLPLLVKDEPKGDVPTVGTCRVCGQPGNPRRSCAYCSARSWREA